MKRNVVFFDHGIGDYILSRPTLAALAATLDGETHLLTGYPDIAFVVEDLGFASIRRARVLINHQFFFDMDIIDDLIGCDRFISCGPWMNHSIERLAEFLQPKEVYSATGKCGQKIGGEVSEHIAIRTFRVAQYFKPELAMEDFLLPLPFGAESSQAAEQAFRAMAEAGVEGILAVHAETKLRKCWSPDGFDAVICKLLSEHPRSIAVTIGLTGDLMACGCHKDRCFPIIAADLKTALKFCSSVDAFIGIDSCMLHASDLAGVPGVGVFLRGATDVRSWGHVWSDSKDIEVDGFYDLTQVDEMAKWLSPHLGASARRRWRPADCSPAAVMA